jgi:hypothetical protein
MVYSFRCAVAQEQSAARPQWNRALLSDVIRAALTLLLMLGCAVCPGATLELDRFVASFVLKAFGTTVGRSEWRLVPIEDRRFLWESRSETAGAGALLRDVYITERSESEIHGQSFRPLAYQYDRYGKNATRNVRVTFDWQNEAVFNTAQAHTWRMSLPPGTLDKLNYLLALMGDLVDGKRSMRYTIADGGRLKTYEMREAGSETLDTALGTLETLKMRRVRHADYGEATLWCAPALGFLPVKLENRDRDGRLVSMYIQSIEGLPPTVIRRPGG